MLEGLWIFSGTVGTLSSSLGKVGTPAVSLSYDGTPAITVIRLISGSSYKLWERDARRTVTFLDVACGAVLVFELQRGRGEGKKREERNERSTRTKWSKEENGNEYVRKRNWGKHCWREQKRREEIKERIRKDDYNLKVLEEQQRKGNREKDKKRKQKTDEERRSEEGKGNERERKTIWEEKIKGYEDKKK